MTFDLSIFCKSTLEDEYSPSCFGETFQPLLLGINDQTYLDWLLKAWGWTLSVSIIGLTLALIIGISIGTLRTLPGKSFIGRSTLYFANCWVELFRNIPVLVQVFLWYHVIPIIIPFLKAVPSYLLVSFALAFFTSARIAEQVKAGIQSLPRGQYAAALALGLSTFQSYRLVILPMALRIIIPPLTSESMNIVKNSSVAFAVSVSELTMFAMQTQEETSRGIEMYLAVTVLYVITAFSVNRIMGIIESKTRIPGLSLSSSSGAH
jgi:glutamate/aspartate transport system permease protein